jgi:hypothetical protein
MSGKCVRFIFACQRKTTECDMMSTLTSNGKSITATLLNSPPPPPPFPFCPSAIRYRHKILKCPPVPALHSPTRSYLANRLACDVKLLRVKNEKTLAKTEQRNLAEDKNKHPSNSQVRAKQSSRTINETSETFLTSCRYHMQRQLRNIKDRISPVRGARGRRDARENKGRDETETTTEIARPTP